MEFYEVVKKRRSIRNYKPDAVPDQVLEHIAEAVALAPSACHRQPVKILAVKDPEVKAKIIAVCPQRFLPEAPVILVAIGDTQTAWQRVGDDHTIIEIDMAIAMEHAVLAATAEGLGTCWVCAYNVENMNEALGLKRPQTALAISPLGYPAREPAPLLRKSIGEVFEIV